MKQLIIGVLLLVGTISSMASDFTITPAFQLYPSFYDASNQTISVDYQFKIHNNMRDPLYLNNQKVVYTSGGFKATLNPARTTCSFYMEKFNKTTPVLPNKDCIIAYTYTLKKSVEFNDKAKSFISTLSVLGQLGLTVNYTATIKLNAYNFTVTPAFQQQLSFYDVGNQTISFNYQFKIHNNMRYPLYLANQKVVYTSDGFKATLNPAGTTCSFFLEKLKKTAPVLPNKDCIIAYTYTLKKSVYFNGKAKSFISTLSVLDELGLTVNYTATIKLKAFSRDTHKHVLLVGLGGTLGDAFKIAVKTISTDDKNYHFINEMIKGGKQDYLIYAGGNSDRPETKQTTLSGPGWATILTGVWADKHGINSNTDIEKNYLKDIPTVFNDIKDARPNAYTVSLAEWSGIRSFANFKFNGQDDAASVAKDPDKDKNLEVTTKAIEELKRNSTPTFMFLHYDAVDKEGQATGYDTSNTAYMNAVNTVLGNANKVLEEVQNLRDSGQQWLVIFTTDHGGKGNESKGRSWQERQVFATYHDPKDKRYSGGGEINAFQGQTNITPTILDYFDIPIPKILYGKPINASDLPVRWLWGRFHAKPAYLDNDYPQLTSNAFPALGDNVKKINKALRDFSAGIMNAYFFLNDGTYITYSPYDEKIISGPDPIKRDWKCLTDPKIASANMTGALGNMTNSKMQYFFSFDNGYITLCKNNTTHDTLDSSIYPEKLEKFSPALEKKIKTAFIKSNWAFIRMYIAFDIIYLLVPKEGIYLKLNPFGTGMLDNNINNYGFSNTTWPGIANFSIQTVLSYSGGGAADKLLGDYHAFFLKPMKYN